MKTENSSPQKEKGISPRCHECSIKSALAASRFANLDENQTKKAVQAARDALDESLKSDLLVQHVVRRVADTIITEKELPTDYDIYGEVKKLSNDLALQFSEDLDRKLSESPSPLDLGLQIAAAGNIIDFGAHEYGSFDIKEEIESLEATSFDRYDIEEFKKALEKGKNVLYLCDNCGEIVFDMLLIKRLKESYPQLQITAAFREKPILNDATMEDARSIGFDKLVPIISSGSVYPGTILPETTSDFKTRYAKADVIISKGQGNFETLLPLNDPRIFFILRIKCGYMAELSGVQEGSLVLMKG